MSACINSSILLLWQLRSPMQIVMAMDVDQRTELQSMIYDLEEENRWNVWEVFFVCQLFGG